MSLEIIVPLVTFVGIGAVVWFLMDIWASRGGRAESRLDMLSDPRRARDGVREEKKGEAFARALAKASPTLAAPLAPKTEAELGRLRKDLVEAGFRSEHATVIFTAVRSICALLFLLGGSAGSLTYHGLTYSGLLWATIIAGLGLFAPSIVLKGLGRRRKKQIFLGLPDALDLMVVCVEAGLGLDQAMRKVAEEMKKSYRVIAEEFGMCNFQLQMGRARNQVLQDLGVRTGVDDLRALASILIQADKFGSSIATALRVQSDSMRVRRQQIAEEKAAKTAVKLIFPLVLFIFPGIFVVLVGPAGIQMARDMFPAMGK